MSYSGKIGLILTASLLAACASAPIQTSPAASYKEGEELFLDEMNLDSISTALLCDVHVFEASPEGFYRKLVELAECSSSLS